MRQKTVNLYQFDELDDTAKEKAICSLADINIDYEWWDGVEMDLERIGCKLDSFDIDRGSSCKIVCDDIDQTAHKIMDEHGEHCDTYKTATAYLREHDRLIDEAQRDENGDFEDVDELDDQLDDAGTEFIKDLQEDYLVMLRQEYEHLTSDEAIIETIEANEYEFTQNGELA